MESDEVLEASTHSRGTISSSAAKSARLARRLLDDRLDDEVAGRVGAQSARHAVRVGDARMRRVRGVLREPSLRDLARERSSHVLERRSTAPSFASPSTT